MEEKYLKKKYLKYKEKYLNLKKQHAGMLKIFCFSPEDEKETNIQRTFPKLWYGWFGSGTSENWIFSPFKQFLITTLDKIKNFRKRGRRKKLEE